MRGKGKCSLKWCLVVHKKWCQTGGNEGLSLLENAAYIGLPVPERLKEVLSQLHRREEKEKEDTNDTGN